MHLDRWAEHTKEPTQDCGALMASWEELSKGANCRGIGIHSLLSPKMFIGADSLTGRR